MKTIRKMMENWKDAVLVVEGIVLLLLVVFGF